MIKIEHVVLASPEQMEFIIESMRNSENSWKESDSQVCDYTFKWHCGSRTYCEENDFYLGTSDFSLMRRLSNMDTDRRKFMRMMPVYARITAPLYWWKEFDMYEIGTVANSCSMMHKFADREFTMSDFSMDKIIDTGEPEYENMYNDLILTLHYDCEEQYYDPHDIFSEITIPALNLYRKKYIETKDKNFWWQMIQLLPSSYNQTRNVMLNYEVLANIYKSRKTYNPNEWNIFCDWIESLPYSELITGKEK